MTARHGGDGGNQEGSRRTGRIVFENTVWGSEEKKRRGPAVRGSIRLRCDSMGMLTWHEFVHG